MLDGFDHPWPAVADHAAEAIVALQMKDTVPDLARLLTIRDPGAPYTKPGKRLVRLRQGVGACQSLAKLPRFVTPPSFRTEGGFCRHMARPDEQEREIRGGAGLLQGQSQIKKATIRGIFVHADVTYLTQDFSRMLPVADPGKGPAVQRFDFFVRERLATERDHMASGPWKGLAYSTVLTVFRRHCIWRSFSP